MDKSYWLYSFNKINIPKKKLNEETDILIIGAGMTGISTAYQLMNHGKKITIVEAKEVGSGVTSCTTAKISVLHDILCTKIKKHHGYPKAKLYFESQLEAMNLVEEIITKEKINCDYKKENAYIYAVTDSELDKLKEEYKTLKEIKADVDLIKKTELPFKIKKAIHSKNNACFHPLKYLYAITKILLDNDVDIHENMRVINIDKIEEKYQVTFENGETIKSSIVVVSTHYPIKKVAGLYFTKLLQDRSYAIAFKTDKIINGMYINIDDPIRSYRNIDSTTMLIGGGSHTAGSKIKKNYYNELEKTIYQYDSNAKIVNRWSTEDGMPIDYLPYIGEYSLFTPNLYVATGYSKWGMTNSHVAALYLRREILKEDNKYHNLYKPNRFSYLKSPLQFIKLLGTSINGLLLSKICIPKKEKESIKVGSGKIINYNGTRYAIYRKGKDDYIYLKPCCTHLGCSLIWNDLDKTWDCKCHGSRFYGDGSILTEPANEPLKKINLTED